VAFAYPSKDAHQGRDYGWGVSSYHLGDGRGTRGSGLATVRRRRLGEDAGLLGRELLVGEHALLVKLGKLL
jgi:hypothetical protein